MNIYEPLYDKIGFPKLKLKLDYYELRVWINHSLILTRQFKSLKEAKDDYYKSNYDEAEENNSCYVEIIHVKPLKKVGVE